MFVPQPQSWSDAHYQPGPPTIAARHCSYKAECDVGLMDRSLASSFRIAHTQVWIMNGTVHTCQSHCEGRSRCWNTHQAQLAILQLAIRVALLNHQVHHTVGAAAACRQTPP